MKRLVAAVTITVALGWSALASAQATSITTTCPTNFSCAFSAAETMSLVAPGPKAAGTPDVFLGYMVFDGSSNVTLTGLANLNGKVQIIGTGTPQGLTSTSPCANGTNGQPATISLSDSSAISFVIDSTGTELQFILSKDPNTSASSTVANGVRVGVCRKQ